MPTKPAAAKAPAKKAVAAKPAPAAVRPVIKDAATIKKVADFAMAKAEIGQLEAKCDALKPALLAAMGDEKSVIAGNHVLTQNQVSPIEPTPNVTITKLMVGQVIPGRKGRRGFTTLTVQ